MEFSNGNLATLPPLRLPRANCIQMVAKGLGEEAGSGDVKIEDLRVVCGGCCQLISCYCLWPDCFGCVTKQECLCCEIDLKACKFLDSETQVAGRALLRVAARRLLPQVPRDALSVNRPVLLL